MVALVILIVIAINWNDKITDGNIICLRFPIGSSHKGTYVNPGIQLKYNEVNNNSSVANQKLGIERPINPNNLTNTSINVFGFVAEIIPNGIPKMQAIKAEIIPIYNVTGKARKKALKEHKKTLKKKKPRRRK